MFSHLSPPIGCTPESGVIVNHILNSCSRQSLKAKYGKPPRKAEVAIKRKTVAKLLLLVSRTECFVSRALCLSLCTECSHYDSALLAS